MKRMIEELVFQLMADQVMWFIHLLIEWLNTGPWQVWFA